MLTNSGSHLFCGSFTSQDALHWSPKNVDTVCLFGASVHHYQTAGFSYPTVSVQILSQFHIEKNLQALPLLGITCLHKKTLHFLEVRNRLQQDNRLRRGLSKHDKVFDLRFLLHFPSPLRRSCSRVTLPHYNNNGRCIIYGVHGRI